MVYKILSSAVKCILVPYVLLVGFNLIFSKTDFAYIFTGYYKAPGYEAGSVKIPWYEVA